MGEWEIYYGAENKYKLILFHINIVSSKLTKYFLNNATANNNLRTGAK